jgi:hypothetical protein
VSAKIEIPEWVNRKTVEEAYRIARKAQESRRESVAAAGMRAAKARDPKILKALEGGSEILRQMSEEQLGKHGVDVGGIYVPATEYNLWREAYIAADEGRALPNFAWIYGAAAVLAGLI